MLSEQLYPGADLQRTFRSNAVKPVSKKTAYGISANDQKRMGANKSKFVPAEAPKMFK